VVAGYNCKHRLSEHPASSCKYRYRNNLRLNPARSITYGSPKDCTYQLPKACCRDFCSFSQMKGLDNA